MPANSAQSPFAIYTDVVAKAAYAYAPGDTGAVVKAVPPAGTTLTLPPAPSNGDRYEFVNQDGTCSPSNPIILAPSAGQTLHGGQASTSFSGAYAWGVAIFDEASSDWFLYFGNAGPGGAATLQPTWFVDNVNGSDANSGLTAALPVKTYAAIASRWRGSQQGIQPEIPISVTITILNGYATGAAAKGDPLQGLLDVNLGVAGRILIQQDTTVVQAGSFTAVTAFARAAASRQTLGSAFVGWAGVQDSLIVDTTATAVAWINDVAAGPKGVTSAPYAPVNPASATPGAIALTPFVNLDNFQIIQPNGFVFVGSGSTTRAAVEVGPAAPQIVLYRLREAVVATTAIFGDPMALATDGVAQIIFAECALNQNPIGQGGIQFVNCALLGSTAGATGVTMQIAPSVKGGGFSSPAPDAVFHAGYTVAVAVQCLPGSYAQFADDFTILAGRLSGGAYFFQVLEDAKADFGNAARTYITTPVAPANGVACSSGGISHFGITDDNGGTAVFYGDTTGASPFMAAHSPLGSVMYSAVGGTPAQTRFAFTTLTFTLGTATSAYGWDPAGGTFVGPTTCTLAHLDAVLGAGTGFGSMAIEPKTGTRMGLQV